MSVWVEMLSRTGYFLLTYVTLHVSVWVEITNKILKLQRCNRSRSTWACELKCQVFRCFCQIHSSRSTWACELKWNFCNLKIKYFTASRSTWACELKFYFFCVILKYGWVTLHVSVWVEITIFWELGSEVKVTLHVSVWVEIITIKRDNCIAASRSTWACELKW